MLYVGIYFVLLSGFYIGLRFPKRDHVTPSLQFLYKDVLEWSDKRSAFYGFTDQKSRRPNGVANSCCAVTKRDEKLHLLKTCYFLFGNFANVKAEPSVYGTELKIKASRNSIRKLICRLNFFSKNQKTFIS